MSDDRYTFAGPPYREPAAAPSPGTAAIDFLRDRAHNDSIAHACMQSMHNGTPERDVIVLALHHYATSLDETREQLRWYAERHSPVMIVRKDPP